ncbi:uncharacterized protein B0I36DRAFT_350588 [Microdochium trichocladiopsis]|uniref:Uncharacterized protein n=1 Tax=Microdochium trichocladiopsis TaxID=1682393 RepID=A0A9P9BQ03_9PEZI|nr:uncharacterized protein B0I36DRAFT_350588 [Microdochium trichocladiopsis]KAH7029772.1 hypothetical protein B0I36DRAFT_350588 [Microdochium trichocladiopsis]
MRCGQSSSQVLLFIWFTLPYHPAWAPKAEMKTSPRETIVDMPAGGLAFVLAPEPGQNSTNTPPSPPRLDATHPYTVAERIGSLVEAELTTKEPPKWRALLSKIKPLKPGDPQRVLVDHIATITPEHHQLAVLFAHMVYILRHHDARKADIKDYLSSCFWTAVNKAFGETFQRQDDFKALEQFSKNFEIHREDYGSSAHNDQPLAYENQMDALAAYAQYQPANLVFKLIYLHELTAASPSAEIKDHNHSEAETRGKSEAEAEARATSICMRLSQEEAWARFNAEAFLRTGPSWQYYFFQHGIDLNKV